MKQFEEDDENEQSPSVSLYRRYDTNEKLTTDEKKQESNVSILGLKDEYNAN